MKKPYQIEAQRAVKELAEMAADGNPSIQMVLPLAEMLGWLRKGVGELVRQAGLQLMELLMQEEVRELAGERSQPTISAIGSTICTAGFPSVAISSSCLTARCASI